MSPPSLACEKARQLCLTVRGVRGERPTVGVVVQILHLRGWHSSVSAGNAIIANPVELLWLLRFKSQSDFLPPKSHFQDEELLDGGKESRNSCVTYIWHSIVLLWEMHAIVLPRCVIISVHVAYPLSA